MNGIVVLTVCFLSLTLLEIRADFNLNEENDSFEEIDREKRHTATNPRQSHHNKRGASSSVDLSEDSSYSDLTSNEEEELDPTFQFSKGSRTRRQIGMENLS